MKKLSNKILSCITYKSKSYYYKVTKEDLSSDNVVNGNKIADELKIKYKKFIDDHVQERKIKPPQIAFIHIGNDKGSIIYIQKKLEASEALGIKSLHLAFPDTIAENIISEHIDQLNQAPHINGMIIQLPIPNHLTKQKLLDKINPSKDIDCLSTTNIANLITKPQNTLLWPCTPSACLEILKYHNISIESKHAVIVNRSIVVGIPLMHLLLYHNATVSICHSYTKDLQSIVDQGDLVISAVGKPHIIKGHWIKPGSVVLDVGISHMNINGKKRLIGDVEFNIAKDRCKLIAPVPGGVGPLTVTMLMKNVIKAWAKQNQIDADMI